MRIALASGNRTSFHDTSLPQCRVEFKLVFGTDKITIDEVTQAIAEFEKTLVTPNSRFDQWLLGKNDALTPEELAGYKLFKNSGCVACHNGEAVGGNSFQKMGVVEPYKAKSSAEGLSAVTGKDADGFKYKVLTLRNVEMTYPYFHDGAEQAGDLGIAVFLGTFGKGQVGPGADSS